MKSGNPTAALLIIGNEILSGRTPDANLNAVAKKLGAAGIPLKETRVVLDVEADIVKAIKGLRKRYTYVFTTGGIGPTHDDITVDAVAAAFGLPVIVHPKARKLLVSHFGKENLTPARLRMARAPKGASLIENPVSDVPGIKIENVYMLAGVPEIMRGMIDSVIADLQHGPLMHSVTVSGLVRESVVADDLREIAARYPAVNIGSYPWVKKEKFGTSLVVRGLSAKTVKQVASLLMALMKKYGVKPSLRII
ncbi:MAG: molybdopterin-binding protein [Bdellovibrionales bacterium]